MIRKALGTVIGGVLALALVGFVPNAGADESNQATRLTFNQPVELPRNVVLPAGTYWFVAPLNLKGAQIVQVFNADRTKVLDAVETVSQDRRDATNNTELTFGRISNGQPVMLMSWFYPGHTIGSQFLYSPKRESQLSEGRQITVMARSGGVVSVG